MKPTKLTLIILVTIIGIAAIIFISMSKSGEKKKVITESTTGTSTSTPMVTEYPEELKAKVRSEFISNCEGKGNYTATECNCAADYLAQNYSESDLAKIYIQYRTSSETPAALEAARNACQNK
jgi:hypothetical protein